MRETTNVVLPTIRFLPVTRDLIHCLVAATKELEGLHLTIADGQEDEEKKSWILSRSREIAEQGKFTYIATKDYAERLRLAFERETEWILPMSDDDIISANLIRALHEAARRAAPDVSAIAPCVYMPYGQDRAGLTRLTDITGETQALRLLSLVQQLHMVGDLMWSIVRRRYYLDWLEFVRTRPYAPTYLDQVEVAYLAMRGKMISCPEMCVYGKDNQVWLDVAKAAVKDASSYPDKSATLIHDVMLISDLYTLLSTHGLHDDALMPLTAWAIALLDRGCQIFDHRCAALEIPSSKECEMVRSLLHGMTERVKSLQGKPMKQYHDFYREVQSICAMLMAAPNETIQRVSA